MRKIKDKIVKLEIQRKKLIALILKNDGLIAGSYSELLVKCGRSGCHCESKANHLVARLGIREDGKIKNKVVRIADRGEVKTLTGNYRQCKQALRQLEVDHQKQQEILREFITRKNQGYS